MDPSRQLLISAGVIIGSMAGGYAAQKFRLLGQRAGKAIMTAVMVAGYSSVVLLAIWKMQLEARHAWLPILGAINTGAVALLAMIVAPLFARNRVERGLLSIHAGVANTGATMGGLVLLGMFGEGGLELASVYFLMWMPFVVFVLYPIARHYSPTHAGGSLGKLMVRSVFNWRSIGLLMGVIGLTLSLCNIPRPEVITRWHVPNVMVYATTIAAYFAIGLRLELRQISSLWRLSAGLAVMRFVVAGGIAAALVALTRLTAWPLTGAESGTIIIQGVMPTAVAAAAVANMFDLDSSKSSGLFLINTLAFLALVLPVIFWIYG
jgi:predicted permease